MLSFAALVILTASAVGLPALWMNYSYLERVASDLSIRTVQSAYLVKVREVDNLAFLVSTRPTLFQLMEEKDYAALLPYLLKLQEGMQDNDMIAICDTLDNIVVSTADPSLANLCNFTRGPYYAVVLKDNLQNVWLLSGRDIKDQNALRGKAIVGIRLDNHFLLDMRDQSGLDHTLLFNDQVIATSFGDRYSSITRIDHASIQYPFDIFLKSFQLRDRVYYTSQFPLNDTGLKVEVALDVTGIKADQRQQIILLTIIIMVVVTIAVLLGALIAQRIHKPLEQLALFATKFRTENLNVPLRVDSQVSEVRELVRTLESSRVGLREALTSLQQEKKWGELLLESIVEGIITLDDNGIITYFSPGAERITGWLRHEVINKPVDVILMPIDRSFTFRSQIPPLGEKSRLSIILKGERKSILSITHAELPSSATSQSTMVLVFRDISEEEALNHLLGHFMANITHEFRTPLSALAASIELLMSETDSLNKSESKELLDSLHLGIINLENLIDNLLEGASIETRRFRISPRPADLQSIVNTASGIIDPLLRKYGQQLSIDLPDRLPLILVDARKMIQVLINLLSNASKYGPNDAQIKLAAQVLPGWIEVSVSDRGPGIPMEYRNDLFSGLIITRIEDGLMKKGAGLGLSVVNAIVKAHGGQVGVRDQAGGGSVFWFTVPITSG